MKPMLFRGLRRMVNLPESTCRHLHFQGPIRVDIDGRRSFQMFHWGHQIENDIFWAGFGNCWEATSLRLWVRLAAQSDVVYDVGANTGIYVLAAKAMRPELTAFAFEPVARVHTKLLANIESNRFDIVAVQAALSNSTGTADLFDVPAEHVYSASLDAGMLSSREDVVRTSVNVTRFDTFIAEHPAPGRILAKIDTERHEFQVLESLGKFLALRRPTLLVEILDRALGAAVASLLDGLGYEFFEIRERQGVVPCKALGTADRNYLLCPQELAAELGLTGGVTHDALEPQRLAE
jgi:FkbM family methyltransferase